MEDDKSSPREIISPRRRAISSPRHLSPRDKKTVMIGEQSTLKAQMSKAKKGDACLMVVYGNPSGHRYMINKPEMVLGRDAVDIRLPDQTVSRKHATLRRRDDGAITLSDMGSANGTFINDVRMESSSTVALSKDMLIKIGSTLLKFMPAGEADSHFFGSLGNTARTDGLTGCMNKGYFLKTLEAHIELEGTMSLIFFDLDHFKNVNDTYGHPAGDAVLRGVTAAIKPLVKSGVFARYGGEEFVILLCDISLAAAAALAEKIRKTVADLKIECEGKELNVTISLGVAELTDEMADGAALLKAADVCVYRAKSAGRNRVEQNSTE